MSGEPMGFVETGIGIAAVLLWLTAVLVVVYRGFILPAVRTDDLKFEVAERRGLFAEAHYRAPATEAVASRESLVDEALEERAASAGEQRRYVVWKAWRNDPAFKSEVRRRYREHYPRYHAELALFVGGVWSLAFVMSDSLQGTLVPHGLDVFFPVYALVAPLWIAVAVMCLIEGVKAALRRSKRERR